MCDGNVRPRPWNPHHTPCRGCCPAAGLSPCFALISTFNSCHRDIALTGAVRSSLLPFLHTSRLYCLVFNFWGLRNKAFTAGEGGEVQKKGKHFLVYNNILISLKVKPWKLLMYFFFFFFFFFFFVFNWILVWCIEYCCVCHQGQICKKADTCLNLYPCVIKYYLILSLRARYVTLFVY